MDSCHLIRHSSNEVITIIIIIIVVFLVLQSDLENQILKKVLCILCCKSSFVSYKDFSVTFDKFVYTYIIALLSANDVNTPSAEVLIVFEYALRMLSFIST